MQAPPPPSPALDGKVTLSAKPSAAAASAALPPAFRNLPADQGSLRFVGDRIAKGNGRQGGLSQIGVGAAGADDFATAEKRQ